jgi:hypothetical protein
VRLRQKTHILPFDRAYMFQIPASFKVGCLASSKYWEPDVIDARISDAFQHYVKADPSDGTITVQVVPLNVQKGFKLSEFLNRNGTVGVG